MFGFYWYTIRFYYKNLYTKRERGTKMELKRKKKTKLLETTILGGAFSLFVCFTKTYRKNEMVLVCDGAAITVSFWEPRGLCPGCRTVAPSESQNSMCFFYP